MTDLIRASDLADPDDLDVGDFEPSPEGLRYRGFLVLDRGSWPRSLPKIHSIYPHRLYVSYKELVGLVPWEGSVVVWPWDRGWDCDLHRDEVRSLLKEEKEKK